MADLKEMTERVVDQEKETIRQEIEAKREEATEEVESARQNLEIQRDQKLKAIDFEMQEERQIQKSSLQNEHRNQILASKQKHITEVLNDAETKLDNIDDNDFQKFTKSVIQQFKQEDKIELILGEKSENKIRQEWLDAQGISNPEVTLSEETVNDESGVIVKQGGVEYNFLFSELISALKPELVSHITQELFN